MNLFKKVLIGATLALASLASPGADQFFSGTGTAQGGTNSYFLIPHQIGSAAAVFNIEATFRGGDNTNAAGVVNFYNAGQARQITSAGASGTNHIYTATNGLAVGDIIVLYRVSPFALERHTVSALASGRVTITGTSAGAIVANKDLVYKMTLDGTAVQHQLTTSAGHAVPLRITTTAAPFFVGEYDRPALIEAFGSNTNILRSVSGKYIPTQW